LYKCLDFSKTDHSNQSAAQLSSPIAGLLDCVAHLQNRLRLKRHLRNCKERFSLLFARARQ
ncbi:MAG: hypothetical protein MRY21_01335, partial [Simkaniaceae bacterium]|nr:hypothetical protein [Simkaniaceae bacterium]